MARLQTSKTILAENENVEVNDTLPQTVLTLDYTWTGEFQDIIIDSSILVYSASALGVAVIPEITATLTAIIDVGGLDQLQVLGQEEKVEAIEVQPLLVYSNTFRPIGVVNDTKFPLTPDMPLRFEMSIKSIQPLVLPIIPYHVFSSSRLFVQEVNPIL